MGAADAPAPRAGRASPQAARLLRGQAPRWAPCRLLPALQTAEMGINTHFKRFWRVRAAVRAAARACGAAGVRGVAAGRFLPPAKLFGRGLRAVAVRLPFEAAVAWLVLGSGGIDVNFWVR